MKPMFFTTLKGYTREQFLKDAVSGVIVAIIALPLSIALALASGVGPEQGLIRQLLPALLSHFWVAVPYKSQAPLRLLPRSWRELWLKAA